MAGTVSTATQSCGMGEGTRDEMLPPEVLCWERHMTSSTPACPHHSPQGTDRQPARTADPIQAPALTFLFTRGSRSSAGYFPKLQRTAAPPDNHSYYLAIRTDQAGEQSCQLDLKARVQGKGAWGRGPGIDQQLQSQEAEIFKSLS